MGKPIAAILAVVLWLGAIALIWNSSVGGAERLYQIMIKADEKQSRVIRNASKEEAEELADVLREELAPSDLSDVSLRDDNILVIKNSDGLSEQTRMFIGENTGENRKSKRFEFVILADMEGDLEEYAFDPLDKLADLVAYLNTKEIQDGGWSLGLDFYRLEFNSELNGKSVQCRWIPVLPSSLELLGLSINDDMNTFQALRPDHTTTDMKIAKMIFKLALIFEDPEWQFGSSDFMKAEPAKDRYGRPAVGFELKTDRKEAFREFTGSNVKKNMAIVFDGHMITDPVIQDELQGEGIISGPEPRGFTPQEQTSLLMYLLTPELNTWWLEPFQSDDHELSSTATHLRRILAALLFLTGCWIALRLIRKQRARTV